MIVEPRKTFIFHFRPKTVPAKTLALSLSWGLGGMAAVLVVLQMGTGLMLKFAFEPTPAGAYASVAYLMTEIPFGSLVRNLHHWGANLLAGLVVLHLFRVFFTGAFHGPRRLNWIIGLLLLLTVFLANFTGYLLPWDQLAYWAVTVSTGMLEYVPVIGSSFQQWVRGGPDLGPGALQLFYTVHTAVVPALFAVLMGFHFWRVRKAGGLVIPREPSLARPDAKENAREAHAKQDGDRKDGSKEKATTKRVPFFPHLMVREAAMAAVATAVLVMLSAGFDAPLAGPANPGLSPNPTKAPWYFAGFQELLLHVHPTVAAFIVPLAAVLALMAMPYFRTDVDFGGTWFVSRSGRRSALAAAVSGGGAALLWVMADHWISVYSAEMERFFSILLPVLLAVLPAAAVYRSLEKQGRGVRMESVQAIFVFFSAGFAALTLVNVWFRAEGMALAWPW